ncbi:MAG: amino acid racemase [Acidobacteriota bacterium]
MTTSQVHEAAENATQAAQPRRVIGILGGLGPHAHLDLERKLLAAAGELAGARADQDFPEWILSSVPQTPDRTAAIRGEGPSALPHLLRSLQRLESRRSPQGEATPGADFVLVACNSAHYYLADLRRATSLPVLDMIDECAGHLASSLPAGARVGILATTGTLASGLYHRALEHHGLRPASLLDADEGRRQQEDLVMAAIYGSADDPELREGLKTSGYSQAAHNKLEQAAARLVRELGCQAIIAGCTEIPLALGGPEVAGAPLIDPTTNIARVAIRRAYELPRS